jgi:hypothetical protein
VAVILGCVSEVSQQIGTIGEPSGIKLNRRSDANSYGNSGSARLPLGHAEVGPTAWCFRCSGAVFLAFLNPE